MEKSMFKRMSEINTKIATIENKIMDLNNQYVYLDDSKKKNTKMFEEMETIREEIENLSIKLELAIWEKTSLENEVNNNKGDKETMKKIICTKENVSVEILESKNVNKIGALADVKKGQILETTFISTCVAKAELNGDIVQCFIGEYSEFDFIEEPKNEQKEKIVKCKTMSKIEAFVKKNNEITFFGGFDGITLSQLDVEFVGRTFTIQRNLEGKKGYSIADKINNVILLTCSTQKEIIAWFENRINKMIEKTAQTIIEESTRKGDRETMKMNIQLLAKNKKCDGVICTSGKKCKGCTKFASTTKFNNKRIENCKPEEVVDIIQGLNIAKLKTINTQNTSDSLVSKKLTKEGYKFTTSSNMMMLGDITNIEGGLTAEITIKDNSKTNGIMGIGFPNIQQQIQFKNMLKLQENNALLNNEYVQILDEYFKCEKMCHNSRYCCGLCYNNKDNLRIQGKNGNELNNLLAYLTNREKFINDMKLLTKPYSFFRINLSGEIHSKDMLDTWIEIAKGNKRTTFYTYTKSYELFNEYLENNKLPKNFILNVSCIEGQQKELDAKYPNLAKLNKFIVTSDNLIKEQKNICGGNCLTCKGELCYTQKGHDIYVAYHN